VGELESSYPDIVGQSATDFLKNHSENKTVVGISVVFYSMSGTKAIHQIDENTGLPCIKQPNMIAALKKKLKHLLSFDVVDGKYTTYLRTFNEKSFLLELANTKLHLSYAEMLYHPTATFTLAREWKVHGKPFHVTWSTGWYMTHLPYICHHSNLCLLY
jgi:hypothetical protein